MAAPAADEEGVVAAAGNARLAHAAESDVAPSMLPAFDVAVIW